MKVITILVFFVVILLPLGSLITGFAPSYGRAQTSFPDATALVSGGGAVLEQFGNALLERSPARRAAISMTNTFSARFLSFVQIGNVVFGKDGWLFYIDDFKRVCDLRRRIEVVARQFEVMIRLSELAGQKLVVAIAPDKSSIYPDRLEPTLVGITGCKAEATRATRDAFRFLAPQLIDHSVPLLAWRDRSPDDLLYMVTDTHWGPLGEAIGLRQIIAAVSPSAAVDPPALSGESLPRRTDLANVMLLLDELEAVPTVDGARERHAYEALRQAPFKSVAFLHDSFHAGIAARWASLDPRVMDIGYSSAKNMVRAMSEADLLFVGSVEREVPRRGAAEGLLSWTGAVGQAILERNARLAGHCVDFALVTIGGGGAKEGRARI